MVKTTSKELIKALTKAGWRKIRIHGSHHIFIHADHENTIVVPYHNTDLKTGILNSILKQAGLK